MYDKRHKIGSGQGHMAHLNVWAQPLFETTEDRQLNLVCAD